LPTTVRHRTGARDPGARYVLVVLTESNERYVSAIDTARETIHGSPFARDEADHELGEQFLRTVVDWSLSMALGLELGYPIMQLLPHPDMRLGYNNPDNLYFVARVSGTGSYRISGERGTSVGLLLLALHELPGNGADSGVTTAYLTGDDLAVDATGSYSIELGAAAPARGTWLPLLPETDNLLVRFTFQDWSRERPGSMSIERLDPPEVRPFEMTVDDATVVLDDAARSIVQQATFYREYGTALSGLPANTMLAPREARGAGVHATQWNASGRFELEPDEALIVTIKDAPQARYSDIMLADLWLNTFEFIGHQVSLNHAQTRADDDGRLRFVASAEDPGVPNWLDTTGQRHGVLFARWQDCSAALTDDHQPELEVVDLGSVRDLLPANTPHVDRDARERDLTDRARSLRARFVDADPALPEIVRRRDTVERLLGHRLALQTIDLDDLDS
jgi:hypothetical protein